MTLEAQIKHVEGTDKGDILLYALSTCGWCRRTKQLLDDLSVSYRYVYVDLLQGAEREEALSAIGDFNPRKSFPTLVIDGQGIIGFKEDEVREALGG